MPHYNMAWPYWILEEIAVSMWLSYQRLEVLDVARIMAHRLHRPTRSRSAIITRMETISRNERERGRPQLCTGGMVDWDPAAVEHYLIHLTSDTHLLRDLLHFDHNDQWLVQAVCLTTSYSPPLRQHVRSLLMATPWTTVW